jgi:PiT family inorganic phosphate transporter
LGVGIAFSLLPGGKGAAVNWSKAGESGLALLLSPILGFTFTILMMFALKRFGSKSLFKEPRKRRPPPLFIRLTLITTCTLVSFFHGSNDGQKGVGLIMLILIGIVPVHFALDSNKNPLDLRDSLTKVEYVMNRLNPTELSAADQKLLTEVRAQTNDLDRVFAGKTKVEELPKESRFEIRRAILLLADRDTYTKAVDTMKTFTDYAPWQVLLMVSLSLACGTTIGWQRIVKTIGERIGKEHLTYAQGASSELVAAAMIGLSTQSGLPTSTTHVLTSSIAGSMVASRGVKNINPDMVRSIALAWLLTLPVTMVLAGGLFLLFRSISG